MKEGGWREEILSMLNLPFDWDSYGATTISQSTVQKAILFVERVGYEPVWLCPDSNGGIEIEFEGIHTVEVMIKPDTEEIVFYTSSERMCNEGTENVDIHKNTYWGVMPNADAMVAYIQRVLNAEWEPHV